ncbi:unnamed protein product [marine sediment metagenome]|uniref:Uncharacterized protein n=1 Tax=marine sediment metagenome TaxID=412755 RepID=X1BYK0_9ZZZZ
MGTDINVKILHGFKIPLSVSFDLKILDQKILDEDDWQLLGEPDYRDEIIENNVTSDTLKNILSDSSWNLYILTSTQEDFDIEHSYLILYNKSQELYYGCTPDYETGTVEPLDAEISEITKSLNEITLPNPHSWEYNLHWIVEGSW